MGTVNCLTCTFSHVNELDDDAGFDMRCLRFPPQLFVLDGELSQAVPSVNAEMVCGEWEGE